MHLHYITLKRQAEFLDSQLAGAEVLDSFTQQKNEWVVALKSAENKEDFLQFSCNPQFPFVLLRENIVRRKNSTTVMEELLKVQIEKIGILPGERIIRIDFAASPFTLFVQLFTHRSNFFLVDSTMRIVNSFKKKQQYQGKLFEIPPNTRSDLSEISENEFLEMVRSHPTDNLAYFLKKHFLHINQTLAAEIVFRCNLSGETAIGTVAEDEMLHVRTVALHLLAEAEQGKPYIYYDGEIPLKFSLIQLTHLKDFRSEKFDTINDALRVFNFQSLKLSGFIQKKIQYSRTINKGLDHLQRTLKKLQQKQEVPSRKETYQKIGELLLAQQGALKTNQSTVRLVDYFSPDMAEIEVKINPKLSLQENAEIYFRRAKTYQQNIESQKRRMADLQNQIEKLLKYRAELEEVRSAAALEKIEKKLKNGHILQKDSEEALTTRLPYKTFHFKNWEIWVGKSARDNDTMTFKFAHKEDWWLHVQGYSGSHIIIRNPARKEQLDSEVLNHAAALAVTNSAAKHASYLPVIYTRVKHVRKPRKSPPGTVIPFRVKTIYSDPLPVGKS